MGGGVGHPSNNFKQLTSALVQCTEERAGPESPVMRVQRLVQPFTPSLVISLVIGDTSAPMSSHGVPQSHDKVALSTGARFPSTIKNCKELCVCVCV